MLHFQTIKHNFCVCIHLWN